MIPAAGAFVAQLFQVRKGSVALRDREAGEAIAFEPKVNRAAGGQLVGVPDSLNPGGSSSGVRGPRRGAACRRQCRGSAPRKRAAAPAIKAAYGKPHPLAWNIGTIGSTLSLDPIPMALAVQAAMVCK